MMTISADLFKAILAMDAYNRGYGAGILNLGGVGSQIGEATLSTDSALTPSTAAAQAAGFYAAAYTVGSQTIISYRGTTFELGINTYRDVLQGWTLGAGWPAADQAHSPDQSR
jgi:hypothetical protein